MCICGKPLPLTASCCLWVSVTISKMDFSPSFQLEDENVKADEWFMPTKNSEQQMTKSIVIILLNKWFKIQRVVAFASIL